MRVSSLGFSLIFFSFFPSCHLISFKTDSFKTQWWKSYVVLVSSKINFTWNTVCVKGIWIPRECGYTFHLSCYNFLWIYSAGFNKKKKRGKKKKEKSVGIFLCVYITKLLGLYTDNLTPAKHMCTDGKIWVIWVHVLSSLVTQRRMRSPACVLLCETPPCTESAPCLQKASAGHGVELRAPMAGPF